MKLKRQQRGHSSGEHYTGILAGEEGNYWLKLLYATFLGQHYWGSEISLTGRLNFKLFMKPE